MNTNQPLSDQMEAYLQGMLSADQESDFLARVERDPLLKGELKLQRDIVEGIRTERRLQLKQRLKGIDVAAPAPGGTATWLRPLGYAAGGAAAVGLLIWALAGNPDEHTNETQLAQTEHTATAASAAEATAPENRTDAATAGTTADPAVANAPDHSAAPDQGKVLAEGQDMQNAVQPEVEADETMTTAAAPNQVATRSTVRSKRASSTESARTRRNRAAETDANTADDNLENEGVENPDIRTTGNHGFNGKGDLNVPTGKIANETETTGKPEVVITESDKLAYQYYDNKLYLYGGFGGELYELIEVHARQEKRLYVYYLDQFYLVRNNTKSVTDLEPIKDENTIGELERLRKRRVE